MHCYKVPDKLSAAHVKKIPWKNGLYANHNNTSQLIRVNGESVELFNTTSFLEFPEADPIGNGTWTSGGESFFKILLSLKRGYFLLQSRTKALD